MSPGRKVAASAVAGGFAGGAAGVLGIMHEIA